MTVNGSEVLTSAYAQNHELVQVSGVDSITLTGGAWIVFANAFIENSYTPLCGKLFDNDTLVCQATGLSAEGYNFRAGISLSNYVWAENPKTITFDTYSIDKTIDKRLTAIRLRK